MQLKIAALSLSFLAGCAASAPSVEFHTPLTTIENARILGDFGPRLGFNAPAEAEITQHGSLSLVTQDNPGAAMLVLTQHEDGPRALLCAGAAPGAWDYDAPTDEVQISVREDDEGGLLVHVIADTAEASWREPPGYFVR